MPAKSQAQRQAAGRLCRPNRLTGKKSGLGGASNSMAHSMSERQLEQVASTGQNEHPNPGCGAGLNPPARGSIAPAGAAGPAAVAASAG
ncbi:MAG: DUF3008 family protein [Proteobacteria bacterium]|nr:DUF3008 family protein [Pseudomonadota bacterium]